MDAFVNTLDHAVKASNANGSWKFIIDKLNKLLTRKDLERLRQYCEDKNSCLRREEDYCLYKDWEYLFIRPQDKRESCLILRMMKDHSSMTFECNMTIIWPTSN